MGKHGKVMNAKYYYYSIKTSKGKFNVCVMERNTYTLNQFNQKLISLNELCDHDKYIVTTEQKQFNESIQYNKDFGLFSIGGIKLIFKYTALPVLKVLFAVLKYFYAITAQSFIDVCSWLKGILIKIFSFLFKIAIVAGIIFIIYYIVTHYYI